MKRCMLKCRLADSSTLGSSLGKRLRRRPWKCFLRWGPENKEMSGWLDGRPSLRGWPKALHKDEVEIRNSRIVLTIRLSSGLIFDRLWETEDRDYRAPLLKYLCERRVRIAVGRLLSASRGRITTSSSVLFLCTAEGHEGSVLCDLGFKDVTVSDFSDVALANVAKRDPRLKTARIDAANIASQAGHMMLWPSRRACT